ncbi:MAG: beta-ketoacyl-[acyl-carrier-protein] synthase family protein [Lachnospiraceae bacterium]|nr:beta-ketoacyl-[acyl-carrier-protein] synthase family protein [Lachnospiraceae bacterium]MCR4678453.1 beta-ketoacyl-[acyl-carrier-protein] synthase family protein [Lachnospiraceae bacterium]
MPRRVVITGIGVISSIGTGKDELRSALFAGKDGKKDIPYFSTEKYTQKRANIVEGFDEKEYALRNGSIEKDTSNVYALYATKQALRDANLAADYYEDERKAVSVSSSLASIKGKADIHRQKLAGKDFDEIDFDAAFLNCATPSGIIGKEFACLGPNISVSTACAAGSNSLGCGYDMIKENVSDMVIAGGVEPFEEMSFSGFLSLKTITPNELTPFDKNRSGIDIGEGAAIVILEELESAVKRGANIYAEVLGYGISNDAFHATSPDPEGNGAMVAMNMALKEAGVEPSQVDYVNAHGTGTQINDKMEIKAIGKVFNEHASKVKISSTKSMHGHMLGATGSMEAIICALGIKEGFFPATTKTKELMDECEGKHIVLGRPESGTINYAVSNSFGFAGNSASIVLGRYM